MPTPEEQTAAMIARLPETTGKALDAWIAIVRQSALSKHGQIVKLLKTEHGVTHGYANLIAHKALQSDAGSSDDTDALVDAQYSGSRAGMRPVYEALLAQIHQFGDDVEIAPKKTYVSLRRSKQFGLLQPAAARLDVGINLKGEPATSELCRSRGCCDRASRFRRGTCPR
jgi:hypothetical protein